VYREDLVEVAYELLESWVVPMTVGAGQFTNHPQAAVSRKDDSWLSRWARKNPKVAAKAHKENMALWDKRM
jgi:hypothetical protein